MIMQALGTTILLAAGAAFCVYDPWNHGVYRYAWYAQTHPRLGSWGLTNIPMLNADIVTGVALMLLFSRFISLKLLAMLIAHITLIIPYVVSVCTAKGHASEYEYV